MTKSRDIIQKELLDLTPKEGNIIWNLSPRIGKTLMGINLIKREKPASILWVSPSNKLLDEDIPEEFIQWKAKRYLNRLSKSTWSSLHKIKGKFDLIILDESHKITEHNSINLINKELTGRIVAMTGTPTKDKSKLDLYKQLDLKEIHNISIDDAVDMKLLADYTINVVDIQYDYKDWLINKLEKALKPVGYYEVKDNTIIFSKVFKAKLTLIEAISKDDSPLYKLQAPNKRIVGYLMQSGSYGKVTTKQNLTYILKNGEVFADNVNILSLFNKIKTCKQKTNTGKRLLNKLEGRVLIFAGSIEQSNQLCEYTYNSKTDNVDLQKFMNNEIDRIAMVNSGGTGFTYTRLDHLIIIQADSDKNGNSSQKLSRSLLKQVDYKASLWILRLKGTQDEKWVQATLDNFNKDKIKYVKF